MKERKLVAKARREEFDNFRVFLEDNLRELHVAEEMVQENVLVFEELFLRIIDQYHDENLDIQVSLKKRVGEILVLTELDGDRFDIDFQSVDEFNPGVEILRSFEDKIGCSYRNRHNTIKVLAKRTHDRMNWWCLIALLLAFFVYVFVDITGQIDFLMASYETVVFPAEMIFGNAMIMISAPVVFFSLVTNISDCFVIANNKISLTGVGGRILGFGAIASMLAIIIFKIIEARFAITWYDDGAQYNVISEKLSNSFIDTIYNIVPQDVFSAFMDISPLPLLLISILTAAALCSSNKYFETIKGITDAINALVCRALSIIMMFLPVAFFLAMLDVFLDDGYRGFLTVGIVVLYLLVGVTFITLFGCIILLACGINPILFFKKTAPAIVENFRINSSIDAVPYNTRFCIREFGISKNKLNPELQIVAQINQIGNTFLIMISSLLIMSYTGIHLDAGTIMLLAILIIIVSVGAPGQEGSLMIGLIVVFSFVGVSFDLIAFIIYIEVFMGRMLPTLNTFFDIVTVVIKDKLETEWKNRALKRLDI